jgi:hypothetical protein
MIRFITRVILFLSIMVEKLYVFVRMGVLIVLRKIKKYPDLFSQTRARTADILFMFIKEQ